MSKYKQITYSLFVKLKPRKLFVKLGLTLGLGIMLSLDQPSFCEIKVRASDRCIRIKSQRGCTTITLSLQVTDQFASITNYMDSDVTDSYPYLNSAQP